MVEEKFITELSEEEADLYDRQIRLWGLESQKRLRSVRVLVAGLNGLGAEVAKNLVLAGVKAVTLLDDKTVSSADFSSQFMVTREDIGKNTMTFVPLSRALQVKAGKSGTGLDKRTSPMFLWLHVLLRFHERKKVVPSSADKDVLLELRDEVAGDLDVDKERINDALFEDISGQIGATCAILGGVLAQEIIKVASCKDVPIRNFFLFNGDECCGLQETVGC